MAVERLACDSELGAQFTDLGAGLAHCGLRQPQSLDDQRVLELGQRGKNADTRRPFAVVVSSCASWPARILKPTPRRVRS